MIEVTEVQPLENYFVFLRFSDGTTKEINFRPFLAEGITRQLLDKKYFEQVSIDEGGGIYWPNGYDACPNFLYEFEEEQAMAEE
ncbi:MAG: DUF2442 domain-containing protein [Ignavibacteriales bacterium]|nr:DUF2442 domain-containing protein [Ignavibacteriales bacterium]